MIRIGLNPQEKQHVINDYTKAHDLKKVLVFHPARFTLAVQCPIPVEHIDYTDIIMYKFFYRLLEEIGNDHLLVFNECLRTQKRSDLTYNCAHHYCNQTPHKIVFEHFPFIDDTNDFMILLDLINKGRYKGKSFEWGLLSGEDVRTKQLQFRFQATMVPITQKDKKRYEEKKAQLFAELGQGDPDTIPRNLHIFAGNMKKKSLDPEVQYVARNDRFKLSNVVTYKNAQEGNYVVIDFSHRRIDFNDFLKTTGMAEIKFLSTGLNVDRYYASELKAWIERVGEFNAQASLYRKDRY